MNIAERGRAVTCIWLSGQASAVEVLDRRSGEARMLAEAPRNFAGRPEDAGRVFRGPERYPNRTQTANASATLLE